MCSWPHDHPYGGADSDQQLLALQDHWTGQPPEVRWTWYILTGTEMAMQVHNSQSSSLQRPSPESTSSYHSENEMIEARKHSTWS